MQLLLAPGTEQSGSWEVPVCARSVESFPPPPTALTQKGMRVHIHTLTHTHTQAWCPTWCPPGLRSPTQAWPQPPPHLPGHNIIPSFFKKLGLKWNVA